MESIIMLYDVYLLFHLKQSYKFTYLKLNVTSFKIMDSI
jgi:hypothetical protein